jgi:hypothetical protein
MSRLRAQTTRKAPFLNELESAVFGRKSALVKRFGAVTQANRQGAPSRSSVQLLESRHRVLSPLFLAVLLGHSPTQCSLPPNGGSI